MSDDAAAAHKADKEQHDRDDQQHVDERADRVAAHDTEQLLVGFSIANGEVVDADETDASLDENRAAAGEADEVAREAVAIPEP